MSLSSAIMAARGLPDWADRPARAVTSTRSARIERLSRWARSALLVGALSLAPKARAEPSGDEDVIVIEHFDLSTSTIAVQSTSTSTSTSAPLESTSPVPVLDEAGPGWRGSFASIRAVTRLEARLAVDTQFDRPGEHVGELGFGGKLELGAELTEGVSVFVAPAFYWVGAIDDAGSDRQILLVPQPEARLSFVLGRFDLRVGLLTFNWGASDLVGPLDVLNPIDYRRNLLTSFHEAKIPVLGAELAGHFGPLSLRAVVEPFFTPSRFFLTGWDTSLIQSQLRRGLDLTGLDGFLGEPTIDDVGDRMLLTDRPVDRPENATIGGRATLRVRDLDLSLTVVHGWEALPQIQVHPDLAALGNALAEAVANSRPIQVDGDLLETLDRLATALENGETVFQGRYNRRDVFGFDAVLALDPFVFKFETAYSLKRTTYAQNYRPVRNPWLNSVLGLEYMDGDTLQIVAEAFALTIFDIPSNQRLAFFEPAAPPPSMVDEGRRTIAVLGLATLARYGLLDGDLLFELGAIATLTRGDVVLLPAVRYRLTETQRISLSAVFVEGQVDGYGGAFGHNDQVVLTYQWTR